jgi:hypothetical protein
VTDAFSAEHAASAATSICRTVLPELTDPLGHLDFTHDHAAPSPSLPVHRFDDAIPALSVINCIDMTNSTSDDVAPTYPEAASGKHKATPYDRSTL